MILLLEPTRPPGFVSGGYRYQAEVMRPLAAAGDGELRAIAPGALAATIARTRAERPDAAIVVDGLFGPLLGQPLPGDVIALLHVAPDQRPWAAAPVHAIATAQTTADAVASSALSVAVVRPGLDECFVPGPGPTASDRLRVVCVGTIAPGKCQALVAAALAALPADLQGELVLLGDERSHPAYADAVRAAAGAVPVRMLGATTPARVAEELGRAHLFVSASRQESFGMAVAEAAACGTPVLAFATGEIATFVRDGTNGWLLPASASDEAFADRLRGVLTHPARLTAARAAARRPPLAGWQSVAERFADACRRVSSA